MDEKRGLVYVSYGFDKENVRRIREGILTEVSQVKKFLNQCVVIGNVEGTSLIVEKYKHLATLHEELCSHRYNFVNKNINADHIECMRIIVNAVVTNNRKVHWGSVRGACEHGHLECLKMLLDTGFSINTKFFHVDLNLLMIHCNSKYIKRSMVDFLLDRQDENGERIDINYRDEIGRTVLHMCISGFVTALPILKDDEIRNRERNKLLIYLIERGAKVDIHDNVGLYPIHDAIGKGNIGAVEILLDKGSASLIYKNGDDNMTVKEYANEYGTKSVKEYVNNYQEIPDTKGVMTNDLGLD